MFFLSMNNYPREIPFEIVEVKILSRTLRNHFVCINFGCSAIGGQSQSNQYRLPALLLSGIFSVTNVIARNVSGSHLLVLHKSCTQFHSFQRENRNDNKLCKLLMKCTHNFRFESCSNVRLNLRVSRFSTIDAVITIFIYRISIVCV